MRDLTLDAENPRPLTAKERRLIKGRIMRTAQARLTTDIKAYLRDYEALVFYTYARGGYLTIGIEAMLPDGSSAYDAFQKELYGESQAASDLAPADQEGTPRIEVVSR